MEFGPEIKAPRITLELSIESKELLERLQREQRTRTECIRDMFIHVLPHQERNDRPTVPSEAAIRLQTRIDAEEFVEKMEALYDFPLAINSLKFALGILERNATIRKDLHDRLPEFADALADNAVTNEGFAVLFGINLEPIFQEVHASNLRKKDGPIVNQKRMKPEGWIGPNVAGELRKQGWKPSAEMKVDEPIQYALTCPLHGPLTVSDTSYNAGTTCIRCENARYNGSEVDPIAEGEAALVALIESASKLKSNVPNIPQRRAIPIDTTIWKTNANFEIPSTHVLAGDVSTVCRVLFFNSEKERRLMIEFLANDELFGLWERGRQDEAIIEICVNKSYIGKVRIASVERGSIQPDQTYTLQVEFTKVD